jgi:hypothetical protein
MKAIEKKITSAWLAGKSASVSNTRTDGETIFLHRSAIVRKVEGGIEINLAGWNTVTTRSRINAALWAAGYRVGVSTRRGEIYLGSKPIPDCGWVAVPRPA